MGRTWVPCLIKGAETSRTVLAVDSASAEPDQSGPVGVGAPVSLAPPAGAPRAPSGWATARNRGAGCGKSARPALRGEVAQCATPVHRQALVRTSQPLLLVLWVPHRGHLLSASARCRAFPERHRLRNAFAPSREQSPVRRGRGLVRDRWGGVHRYGRPFGGAPPFCPASGDGGVLSGVRVKPAQAGDG